MPSHAASVTDIAQLAPSILQITVALEGDTFRFQPGQWVNFRFPEGVSRAYTIASPAQRFDRLELCVRVGAGGRGAEALQHLARGASVRIDGPYGDFVLPDGVGLPVVFLAGDTGIAPVRSIVLTMLANDDPRHICVLYEPDHRHILYANEFDPLARNGRIVHESGAIETLIQRNRRHIHESTVMIVGFDDFLDRARAELAAIEVDPQLAITETFGPKPS